MISRSYKTDRGTELPLLNLRGKEYLEVKYRLVWFREEHPNWSIETEFYSVTNDSAYAKATIRDETGRVIATSHKFESAQGFPDFIEKAETGAIGRALALIGFGTQFCADELDEGRRIVDSPVDSRRPLASAEGLSSEVAVSNQSGGGLSNDRLHAENNKIEIKPQMEPGDFVINFGRKYKGKKIKDIPRTDLDSYLHWLSESADRGGTTLSYQVKNLQAAFNKFYDLDHANDIEFERSEDATGELHQHH